MACQTPVMILSEPWLAAKHVQDQRKCICSSCICVQVASLVVTGLEWEEIEASESPALPKVLPSAPNGQVNTAWHLEDS